MITAFFISLLLSFANFSNSETFSPIPASDFSEIGIPQPSNLSVVDTLIFPGTICDTLFTGETAVWPITITNILDTANLLFEIDVDDEGGDFNESSVVSYSTSGASTVHTFSDVSPNIQQMYLQVVLNGDFDSPLERAEVWIEGIFFGSINDNDVPNGTDIIANFTIQNSTLDILLLDNVIEVLIQNTSTVGIANGNSDSHIVSLTSSSATWFSIDQNSGAVPDGESLTFNMTLDADKLFAGTYFFDMLIEFPDHPLDNQIVPVKLVVIGAPVFAATDTLIDFGTAFVNQPKFMDFEVTNEGTVALNFLSITTNNSTFLFNSGPFTLQPFESQTVTITFIAPDEESYNGSLLIATNEGNYFIELIGAGLHPPAIEVMPDSFCINLDAGEITTENVMITNTGSNMLEYSQFNYGGCTKNIIETFEDGAIQDFSVNNPGIYSFVFTPNDPAEGDFSLRIQGGNFVHYNGLSASLENCRPEHISFFVKSASQSTADGYFVLKNDLFEDVIFFFMSNDGTMGIFNSALETYMVQYEPHVWFFIEMKNFDFTNQQYDYYVDG